MKDLMLGNEAIARGAYEAHCTVASAYPGTPSTEITEYISKYSEIYSEWAPNEKVSIEVAFGASVAGARSICAMKHVGLNVAADPLFTASYTGVNGGLVIVVADDPGMHSSQNEQDSRHYAVAAKVPMLEPADSQECKDFIKEAFHLSEKFDTPFLVRLTTRIAHSQSLVEQSDREKYQMKEYKKDYTKFVMIPGNAKKRHVFVEERTLALQSFAETTDLNKVEWGSKDIGIITNGVTYQYVREALGEDVSVLRLGMVNPLPVDLIKNFASQVKRLYVIEELEPIIESHVKNLGIDVIGKDRFTLLGEYSVKMIREKILNEVQETESRPENVPNRTPVLCPGCPHRGLAHVLRQLKLEVMGDIGCYTLAALPPTEAMDVCLCMGASVGMAHGMEKARIGKGMKNNTVALLGDSTFIHSGITGLIDIVYNKGNSTVIIADNSITGMTGHQHNPTTGYTIKNEPTRQTNLEMLVKSVGVERIRVVDPFELNELKTILKEEVESNEPSVIITRRPCVLIEKTATKTTACIDADTCKRCKACLVIGCPAIEMHDNTLEINEALCVGCMLCAKICKFNSIHKVGE